MSLRACLPAGREQSNLIGQVTNMHDEIAALRSQ
jgi:hypothetical protein